MKKIISLLLSVSLLISLTPLNSFGASEQPLFSASFEGEWFTSGWFKYHEDTHIEGVLWGENNSDPEFITDGNQSLYVIDKDAEHYYAIATPIVDITDFGEYTLSVDTRVLSGNIKFYVRAYESNKSDYDQTLFSVPVNESMDTYTFKKVITPDTPYVRILVYTDTLGANEEGYVDNMTFTKTGGYNEEEYYAKKSVIEQLEYSLPGDVTEIPDGTYYDWNITINCDGNDDAPITLKAKNPGKVIFKGSSSITVTGDYVNIEGLRFEEVTSKGIVKFDTTSYGSKLIDCAIYNCHPEDPSDEQSQTWVMLRGTKLTVENCFFYGKHSKSQMVESSKSELTKDIPDEHLIKNCYFGNIKKQNVNGYEAIRLGSSTYSFDIARTVVEGCFFEKCDGESEIISLKSCELTVRNNTLYNSNGSIVLRHGNRSDIYGNLFIGAPGKTRLSGVRIIGEDHKVHNNYFYNMPDRSQVLVFYNGDPYEGILDYWYYPVKNAEVYNNTFIGGDELVAFGGYSPDPERPEYNRIIAPEGYFKDNALVTYQGKKQMLTNGDPTEDLNVTDPDCYHKIDISGNIAYGKELGYSPDGVTYGYFELIEDGKYYKAPQNKGADLNEVKKAPTSPFDIIPDWVKEVYYDSGLVTFDVVPNDIFNDDSVHLNDFIPFDVTGDAGEGGTYTLYENGTAVSNKKTFTNNPTITFKATPDDDKVVSLWYVNGVEANENNMEDLGVNIEENELTINNLIKNYNIEVEFKDRYAIPDAIEAPVNHFGEMNGNITVKNQEGIKFSYAGNYRLLTTKLEILEYADIIEYGFKVKDGEKEDIKAEALIPLTSGGAYGILLYGLKKDKTYTVYPYAVYKLENGTEKTIYGSEQTFVCE